MTTSNQGWGTLFGPRPKYFRMKKYLVWQKNQCLTFNQVCAPRSRGKEVVLADGKQGVVLCRILDVRTKTLKNSWQLKKLKVLFVVVFFQPLEPCTALHHRSQASQALLLLQGCATHNVFQLHLRDKTRR